METINTERRHITVKFAERGKWFFVDCKTHAKVSELLELITKNDGVEVRDYTHNPDTSNRDLAGQFVLDFTAIDGLEYTDSVHNNVAWNHFKTWTKMDG